MHYNWNWNSICWIYFCFEEARMVRINIFQKKSQKSAEKNYSNYYTFFKTKLNVTNEVLLELQCISTSKFGFISETTNMI